MVVGQTYMLKLNHLVAVSYTHLDVYKRQLSVSGGVSCNGELRSRLKAACNRENVELVLPDFDLTTDNAAMIALSLIHI